MEESMDGNQKKWHKYWPEKYSKPSKLEIQINLEIFVDLLNYKYLVEKKHCNNEGGRHDSSGMSSFPDFDMDMVQGHVVLSAENKSKQDDNVDHLPGDKEEDE